MQTAPRRLVFNEPDKENCMHRNKDQQVQMLEDLVKSMVKAVVEREDRVVINRLVSAHNAVFEVTVDNNDVGLVLGREGVTANAMRSVLQVAAKKTDFKVHLDVVTQDQRRG